MKNALTVSFARDIRPLFTKEDVEHMKPMDVLLDQHTYMADPANNYENAKAVYDSVTGKTQPQMPMKGPYWTKDKLDLFESWMKGGYQP